MILKMNFKVKKLNLKVDNKQLNRSSYFQGLNASYLKGLDSRFKIFLNLETPFI